jgi:hypothetical protein
LLIQASAKVDQAAYAEYIAEGIELPPPLTSSSLARASARSTSPAASVCTLAVGKAGLLALADLRTASRRSGHTDQETAIDVCPTGRLGGIIPPTWITSTGPYVRAGLRLDHTGDQSTDNHNAA